MREGIPVRGHIRFVLFDESGTAVHETECHNLITDLGEAYIADQLSDGGVTAMSHMAIGDSSGQVKTDTTLANETARVALDSTTQGTSGDDNDVIYVATFPAGTGTGTVSEVGILNAASVGTLFNYSDQFESFTKGASQSAVVTITVTIGTS